MKPFVAFSFIIALTACAHTQPRLNGSGTQYQLWQTQVLEECARKGKQLQLL